MEVNKVSGKRSFSTRTFKLIVAIILLVVGLIMVLQPNVALSVFTMILGIGLLGYSAISIIVILARHEKGGLVLPIVLAALGVILLIFNDLFANTVLPFVIGAWMVIMGITSLVSVRKMGLSIANTVLSCAAIAIGIIILVGVFTGGNMLATLLGVCMLVYGVVEIINFIMIGRRDVAPF